MTTKNETEIINGQYSKVDEIIKAVQSLQEKLPSINEDKRAKYVRDMIVRGTVKIFNKCKNNNLKKQLIENTLTINNLSTNQRSMLEGFLSKISTTEKKTVEIPKTEKSEMTKTERLKAFWEYCKGKGYKGEFEGFRKAYNHYTFFKQTGEYNLEGTGVPKNWKYDKYNVLLNNLFYSVSAERIKNNPNSKDMEEVLTADTSMLLDMLNDYWLKIESVEYKDEADKYDEQISLVKNYNEAWKVVQPNLHCKQITEDFFIQIMEELAAIEAAEGDKFEMLRQLFIDEFVPLYNQQDFKEVRDMNEDYDVIAKAYYKINYCID